MFAIFLHEGMDPFYENISSFPTAIFTFLLCLCLLYWLVAVLGLVELDVLDFDVPDMDGAVEMNPDSGVNNVEGLAGLAMRFGLYGVPVTIIVSLIALVGWLVSYYAMHYGAAFAPNGPMRWLIGLPVLCIAFYVGVIITAVIIKPLRSLFNKASQQTVQHILGQTAIVRTSRVDRAFGEAALEDGGASLILKIRAHGDEIFTRGDRVVLLERLENENAYRVVSEQEFNP